MPRKDRYSPEARELQKAYSKAYYHRNKPAQIERNRYKRTRIKEFLHQYKEAHGCMDCGGKFPHYVLDLDHRDPTKKLFTPSRLYKTNSWNTMVTELEKCDVVCANCHRERTHNGNHYIIGNEYHTKKFFAPDDEGSSLPSSKGE